MAILERRQKMQALLSEDPNVIAGSLKTAINKDLNSDAKKEAKAGVRYYNHENDILNNRIFYIDDEGNFKEDRFASIFVFPMAFFLKSWTRRHNIFYLIQLNTTRRTTKELFS